MSAIVGAAASTLGGAVTAASSVGWFIPMLVAAIAYFQYEEFMDPESRPIDMPTANLFEDYDFIIVGAGSAGKTHLIGLIGLNHSLIFILKGLFSRID